MSLPLDMRFTDPTAPLFIDVEGDHLHATFVISTSQVHGAATTKKNLAKMAGSLKRGGDELAPNPVKVKRPMKAALRTELSPFPQRSESFPHSRIQRASNTPPHNGEGFMEPSPTYEDCTKQTEPLFLPSSSQPMMAPFAPQRFLVGESYRGTQQDKIYKEKKLSPTQDRSIIDNSNNVSSLTMSRAIFSCSAPVIPTTF